MKEEIKKLDKKFYKNIEEEKKLRKKFIIKFHN